VEKNRQICSNKTNVNVSSEVIIQGHTFIASEPIIFSLSYMSLKYSLMFTL